MTSRALPPDDDHDHDVGPGVLAGLDIGARFYFWSGQSGRRYVFSVFALDDHPAFERAVVVAARRNRRGRCLPLWIGVLGGEQWHSFAEAAAEVGTEEVHLHLLAGDEASRERVVDDLDLRSGRGKAWSARPGEPDAHTRINGS